MSNFLLFLQDTHTRVNRLLIKFVDDNLAGIRHKLKLSFKGEVITKQPDKLRILQKANIRALPAAIIGTIKVTGYDNIVRVVQDNLRNFSQREVRPSISEIIKKEQAEDDSDGGYDIHSKITEFLAQRRGEIPNQSYTQPPTNEYGVSYDLDTLMNENPGVKLTGGNEDLLELARGVGDDEDGRLLEQLMENNFGVSEY